MPQVVLKAVAVGVVVDQKLVDVGQEVGAQQVAHAFEVARRAVVGRGAVAEHDALVETRREERVEVQAAQALDASLQSIERLAARHAVAGVERVPIDLRVAGIAAAPGLLRGGIARIARQVAVVVGHGRASVVPPQRAVLRPSRLHGGPGLQVGGFAEPERAREHGDGPEFAPDARIAHLAVLIAPRRVVEPVAREGEGLVGGGCAQAPHRGRHDEQQRHAVAVAEAFRSPERGGQRMGEDTPDMQVAPRARIGRRGQVPAPADGPAPREAHDTPVVAVGQPRGETPRGQRLALKAEIAHAVRRAVKPGRLLQPRTAHLRGAERTQRRSVAHGHREALDRRGTRLESHAAACGAHEREVVPRDRVVEVIGRLHGAVKKRGVGEQRLAPLLRLRFVRIVFGFLRRSPECRHEARQHEGPT